MPHRPAVTAVIPTHNRPQLMQRALESVLAQDYEGQIEVIVVFDASEPFDPPVDVPDGRTVEVVTNVRSRGLAGARNTGIMKAANDFVAFLDDDDWWLPGKLSAQMRRFEDRPDAALVGTAVTFVDGERVFDRLVPLERVGHADLLQDRMAGLHSSTFVFRRAALTGAVGLVDEDLPGSYGEDYDLLLRTALVAPVEVVNQPLVNVTWAAGSYFFGKWSAYADGLSYLRERHPEFQADSTAEARICSQIAFARAAAGERRAARTWVRRSLRRNPRQVKAWLALAIALRLLPAGWVISEVQKRGKGI